jgi:rhodanese-related sulfurtransferase
MSKETVGTLGNQKATNYALRANMTEQEFIDEVNDGLLAPPAYFPANVKLNKEGYENIEDILKKGQNPISPVQVEALTQKQAIILDVRHQSDFAKAHIPNSIFIGLDGSFAPWVGSIIADVKQPIILVVEKNRLKEAITRLSRVGFDNIIGFVEGGVEAWIKEGLKPASVETIDAESFAHLNNSNRLSVYDVRKPVEYEAEHIINAKLAPLSNLSDHLKEFNSSDKNFIHCAGGYRSMIANSILKKNGIQNIVDVLGGFAKIKQTDIITTEFNCSSI